MTLLSENSVLIMFPKKEDFIPGELYFVNQNWTFYRDAQCSERTIDIPAYSPFMFIGISDQLVKKVIKTTVMEILVGGDTFGYFESTNIFFITNNHNVCVYRVNT